MRTGADRYVCMYGLHLCVSACVHARMHMCVYVCVCACMHACTRMLYARFFTRVQNNPASWSLRDFETQATDPFEMAELKTIDVMAELSTVFPSQAPAPGTTAQQGTPSPAAGAAATSGGSSPVNGVATLGTATASSATADARQQPQAVPRATARPAGGVAMPGLRAPSPNNALTTTAVTAMTDAGAPAAAAVASSGAAGQATLSACSSGAPVPSPRPRPRPRASPGAVSVKLACSRRLEFSNFSSHEFSLPACLFLAC